jgi:hypothetical protein
MAARSPPSPVAPPPPARRLGPRSPRIGRGAEVHAVRSDASGLAGAAREVIADKCDVLWRDEEGSEGRRGPAGAAPAHAPLLSAPMGSRRLEGISVEEAKVTRTQLLEEELSSLKEELALCQVLGRAAGLASSAGPGPWGARPAPRRDPAARAAGIGRVGLHSAPRRSADARQPRIRAGGSVTWIQSQPLPHPSSRPGPSVVVPGAQQSAPTFVKIKFLHEVASV